ncbi:DNA repair-scaffolding protein isoform X7 [Gasterosteus aculeatus]
MSSRKRRRCSKDVTGVSFPDEVEGGSKPAGREPPSLSSASSAKSWERCGDSFLENNLQTSGRKLSDIRKFPTLVQTAAVNEDPVHIAWSSSDGEQSDDETQEQQQQLPQRPARPSAPAQSYSRALRMLRTEKDFPAIDTDSDLDASEGDVEKDSGPQISDCESERSVEKPESPLRPSNMTEPEISGYVSGGECAAVAVTASRADSPVRSGEASKRSVSDWVRSAQALLQTPQKPQSKAPLDSAKKKRKFQSGGLAERLNRLQGRQRSAVSFWRHQSISDTTTTTTTVDRPGVLVLEVLEVQEECSMQLARCERRPPPGEDRRRQGPPPEGGARLLVLFSRETAAGLMPAPGDVIHVYPPWLCVLVQDGYGTFSVVQLHLLPCSDDLHRYCRQWQGRTCLLRGIKVVQRVTRERSTRLFSLIDSLWPPAVPLQDHGDTASMSPDSRSAAVAPRFCYLLSGQESSVEPTGDRTASPLYLPPTKQTLRDAVQSPRRTRRCSFVATVLHKRKTQGRDVGQGEVWLLLTDAGLQEERRPEGPCRRTVALCVSTSCALTSSVLESLNSPAPCRMSFRDAVREHGVLLCAEQSVVEVCSVDPESEPQAEALPRPVRLDPLTAEVTPNSVCSLSGVIVGVDETTAYSWPACNRCGSDNLEMLPERRPNLRCVPCESPVDEPDTRVQLEVFLSSSLSNCTLKVKLQQKTIASILNSAALEAHEFPGYDVEKVLGKEVGPLAVYVRVVTRKPALWIGLEEICL